MNRRGNSCRRIVHGWMILGPVHQRQTHGADLRGRAGPTLRIIEWMERGVERPGGWACKKLNRQPPYKLGLAFKVETRSGFYSDPRGEGNRPALGRQIPVGSVVTRSRRRGWLRADQDYTNFSKVWIMTNIKLVDYFTVWAAWFTRWHF